MVPDVGVVADSLGGGGAEGAEGREVGGAVCAEEKERQHSSSTRRREEREREKEGDEPVEGNATSTRYSPLPSPPIGTNA